MCKLKERHSVWRVLDSIVVLWVSHRNHIPMNIDYDKNADWFSAQLQATYNVNQSLFNDWFTGLLNFQIEHQDKNIRTAILDQTKGPFISPVSCLPTVANARCPRGNEQKRSQWCLLALESLNLDMSNRIHRREASQISFPHNASTQLLESLVKSLCAKHGIKRQCKPLLTALADVVQ
ncbi:unnamed protein product [Lepidochelys kempii]